MGFADIIKRRKAKQQERKPDEFVPSTKRELKEYASRAREREESKKQKRDVNPKEQAAADRQLMKRQLEARIRDRGYTAETKRLAQNLPVKLNRKACIARFDKIIGEHAQRWRANKKENEKKGWLYPLAVPVYVMTGKVKADDDNFVYEVTGAVGQFSWKELVRLISAGLGKKDFKTTDWIEAFRFAINLMLQTIGAETDETEVRYRLTDRKALFKLWPVKPVIKAGVKKVSKEEYMVALLAGRRKADEEDDEDEDEDDESEDEDEDEDEEEDEEDEKPVKKKSKKSKSKKKDEDDEDEEADDDDDADEEDADEDDESDDEDSEDDEDAGEDEKPTKRKRKVTKIEKKKTAAKTKKEDAVEKKPKKTKASRALELFSRKRGASLDEVSEKLDIPVQNVRAIIAALRNKGETINSKGRGTGVFFAGEVAKKKSKK
jgi:hypothetical protein